MMKKNHTSKALLAASVAVACCISASIALGATADTKSAETTAGAETAVASATDDAADAADEGAANEDAADDATDEGAADASDEGTGVDKAALLAAAAMTEADEVCTTCHTTQSCAEVTHTGISCTLCHDSTDEAFIKRHEGKTADSKMPTKLKKTTVDTETCLMCHSEDYTTDAVGDNILTDTRGTEVNPHAVPSNESHDKKVDCLSCHKIHEETDIMVNAEKVCYECHHVQVFECNTCHEA